MPQSNPTLKNGDAVKATMDGITYEGTIVQEGRKMVMKPQPKPQTKESQLIFIEINGVAI
jgi:hypothetical protein